MHSYFFIKSDGRFIKINFKDILFVEGCRNYVRIYTEDRFFMVLVTMKRMEECLPFSQFRRIHKSYIVALNRISSFDQDTVYLQEKELPLGLQFKQEFLNSITLLGNHEREMITENPALCLKGNNKTAVFVA